MSDFSQCKGAFLNFFIFIVVEESREIVRPSAENGQLENQVVDECDGVLIGLHVENERVEKELKRVNNEKLFHYHIESDKSKP